MVVAVVGLLGVLVTAAGALLAAWFSRSTNREVKYRNGGGADGTLAERLDARFERIEQRFDRLERKDNEHDARISKNNERITRTERNVREMRAQAFAFFDRFYLKERDEERVKLEERTSSGDGEGKT